MIRESLTDNSRYAMMEVTPGQGLAFQFRLNPAGSTNRTTDGTTTTAPYWIKLVRSGKVFTGYKSIDGVNWVQVGTGNSNMANTVYIGLAVTSKNNSALCTAVFDSVSFGNN